MVISSRRRRIAGCRLFQASPTMMSACRFRQLREPIFPSVKVTINVRTSACCQARIPGVST
jgi:hypothetical protein